MPTILELFRGSNKDISPNIPNQFPVQERFKGSTQESAVKPDRDTVIEQELTGIRIRSAVELNNPLIYGNQAIRIATRSTSSVEKMKQATGGTAGDGGLIGKGLGAITGGKFGKFVFGGKVTSLNQARDGVNSRLGIPQNVIPTYVNNTGELQKGLEPDTMITLGKIKSDARGTLFGQFLKQTGGGNPKTIGRQILGQGISLVKDKVRTTLFGNPNTLGANGALASQNWEYSSTLPYSKQVSNVKFNSKSVNKVDKGATDITKKVTQLQLDAKEKLGKAASNATASLKKRLTGAETKTELNKFLDEKNKEKTDNARPYNEKYSSYINKNSVETNLGIPNKESTDTIKKDTAEGEKGKEKLGPSATSVQDTLTGDEYAAELDKALESKTKETSATAKLYEEKYNKLVERASVETNLKVPGLGAITEVKKDEKAKEESKKKLGLPEGFTKPKLTGTESKPEIDKATESKTKETSDTPTTYTGKIGNYKTEDVSNRIDLSLVSPIKGIDRRKTKGRYGLSEYAFFDPKNTTGKFSPNDPTRKYTGVVGTSTTGASRTLAYGKGLGSHSDSLNTNYVGKKGVDNDFGDLIPLRMSNVSDTTSFIHFRAIVTGISETSSPSWDSSKFVGNPYNFYTYSGVERSISFTIRSYCMSLQELALMWTRLNWLTSQTYPTIVNKIVQAPFIKMTIGSIYSEKVGFINSLTYTINDDVTWETEVANHWLPKVVDIQIEFKLVESAGAEKNSHYSYGLTPAARNSINNARAEQKDVVIGQDPITNPQPARGVDFKQVETIPTPPPPAKVDDIGTEQSTPPPAKVDNTPKNIDTGKPAETPQAAEKPAVVEQVTQKAEAEVTKVSASVPAEFKEYPQWTYGAFRMAKLSGYSGGGKLAKISNIKKIDEKNYYFKVTDSSGNEDDKVMSYVDENTSRVSLYEVWVGDNDGKDPMGLIEWEFEPLPGEKKN